MDRRAILGVALGFCLLNSVPQTGEQSSTPASRADTSPAPTLRVYSRLVLLDVAVTDRKGNPVHGLKRAEFYIADNKRPQQISTFEEHVPNPKPTAFR